MLAREGFINVHSETWTLPVGAWAGADGTEQRDDLVAAYSAMRGPIFEAGGFGLVPSEQEYDDLLNDLTKEWDDRPDVFEDWTVVYAQKRGLGAKRAEPLLTGITDFSIKLHPPDAPEVPATVAFFPNLKRFHTTLKKPSKKVVLGFVGRMKDACPGLDSVVVNSSEFSTDLRWLRQKEVELKEKKERYPGSRQKRKGDTETELTAQGPFNRMLNDHMILTRPLPRRKAAALAYFLKGLFVQRLGFTKGFGHPKQ
ncbi:hypothetical protein F5146DRAFT_1184312 [Armillaria mellea]|nr:hypothetical protein F5146DRAFT_1184312 [Armillaria mellea]